MDEKNNAASKMRRDGARDFAAETTSDERFTVRDVERDIRRSGGGRDFSTTRSRKQRRRQERGSGLILWLSVFLIVSAYLGLLFFSKVRERVHRRHIPVEAPQSGVDVAANPVESASAAEELPQVPETAPVIEVITRIKQAQRYAEEGRRLARNRNYAQAVEKFTQAKDLSPASFQLLLDLAQALWEIDRVVECRDVLIDAVAFKPDSLEARMLLAKAFYDLGQSTDALAVAQWILDGDPYSLEANRICAEIYTGMKRHDLAIAHWQRIAALNADNTEVKNSLGVAQLQVGQVEQAIATFDGILKTEPANSQAHYYLAISLIRKNDPAAAVDALARAKNRLGQQFVEAWTQSSEFDPVKNLPAFARLFPASTPAPDAEEDDALTLDPAPAPATGVQAPE